MLPVIVPLPSPRRCVIAAAAGMALLIGPAPPAGAQSGACAETGPAAAVVCRDPTLSALSRQLSETLKEIVGQAAREDRRRLIREQRDWSLAQRDCFARGDASSCLVETYQSRISALSARLPADVEGFGEAGTGLDRDAAVETATLPPLGAVGAASTATQEAEGAGATGTNSASRETGGTELGALRGGGNAPATARGAPASLDGTGLGAILTAIVWKADIATGVRPGTIFIFHKDGALVTADCVESYKLGSWALSADQRITLNDGSGAERSAEIVSARDEFVRLQIDGSDDRRGTLVLRPALAPFSCKSG